jgi:hypothetical protein
MLPRARLRTTVLKTMSNFASHSPAPSNVPVPRLSVPPYAVPASVAEGEPLPVSGGVRPFVPQPWRAAFVAPELTATVEPTVVEPTVVASMATPVAAPAPAMEVPARIPPYQPLRPTPIMTAAIRTPLYIPTIPPPAAEAAVEDEGMIEPQLVHSDSFSAPAAVTPEAVLVDDGELPWIDAFLSSTPAVPMATIPTPLANALVSKPPAEDVVETAASAAAEVAEVVEVEDVVATVAELDADHDVVRQTEEVASTAADLEADTASSDAWPLDDAVAQFRELSAQLDAAVHSFDSPEELFTEALAPEPLPAWSDDDLMDIMPIRHSGKTPLSSPAVISEGELWSERARKAQEEAQVFQAMASAEPVGELSDSSVPLTHATAEQAAHALEVLAQRVRAGELTLPGYDPRMGESAALVAALAAILGVRFR